MKRLIPLMLCCVVLLWGCGTVEPEKITAGCETTSETTEQPEPVSSTQEPDTEAKLEAVREQLGDGACTFSLSQMFQNFAKNGFSSTITQTQAQDGSFSFVTQNRIWDHQENTDQTSAAAFYYIYEDKQLVCYVSYDGGEWERSEIDLQSRVSLNLSRANMVGAQALLPQELTDLEEAEPDEQGNPQLTFRVPVETVMQGANMQASYLNRVFSAQGVAYDAEWGLYLTCTVSYDAETFRPIRLSVDYSEVKPYVLTDGALSAEFAFDTDLMTTVYEFSFALPETTSLPEDGGTT